MPTRGQIAGDLFYLTRNHHFGVTWMRAPGLASPSIQRDLFHIAAVVAHIRSADLAPPLFRHGHSLSRPSIHSRVIPMQAKKSTVPEYTVGT